MSGENTGVESRGIIYGYIEYRGIGLYRLKGYNMGYIDYRGII